MANIGSCLYELYDFDDASEFFEESLSCLSGVRQSNTIYRNDKDTIDFIESACLNGIIISLDFLGRYEERDEFIELREEFKPYLIFFII